jgi:phage terminase large subunit GpA-like protein
MNLRQQDARAFSAEYQNEPEEDKTGAEILTPDAILAKIGPYRRGTIPDQATHLMAGVDVQGKCLYWQVAAWAPDFTGWVIAYGTLPDQQRAYFTLSDARHTLDTAFPGKGPEGRIYAGLDAVCNMLLSQEWTREGGGVLRIGRLIIDANWGDMTNTVYQFCRQTRHAALVVPSHGQFIGARKKPYSEYRQEPGGHIGHHWRVPPVDGRRTIPHVLVDTNYWKTFVHEGFATGPGDPRCLMLHASADPEAHRMYAEQICAESYRPVKDLTRANRIVNEWDVKPGKPDNHFFDTLILSAVGAAMLGCQPIPIRPKEPGQAGANAKRRRRLRYFN